MGRTARDNRDRPHPRPVERIELSEEHIGRRVVTAGVLLLLGTALLVYAVSQLFAPQGEWTVIQAGTGSGTTCGEEFTFLYHLGGGSLPPAAEQRAVAALYTELCRKAYQMFHADEAFSDTVSVRAINSQPNTVLEIEPALYAAFEAVEESGSRALYLGPVYDRYESIFFCQDDSQLADFDPRLSEEVRLEYQAVADFANDPGAVQLELLGEGKIRLYVSEEYLAYARREGIETFIDFAWMRNAFIADYLAGELAAAGYSRGVLSSYDGFVRNMDGSGTEYALTIYGRQGQSVSSVGEMTYQGPLSIVLLRDYPISELDSWRFYQLQNGEVRTSYLDPADGMCRSALHELTCYAGGRGCGELLLAMLPVYVADSFREEEISRLSELGIQSIYCQEGVVYHTDPQLALTEP